MPCMRANGEKQSIYPSSRKGLDQLPEAYALNCVHVQYAAVRQCIIDFCGLKTRNTIGEPDCEGLVR